MGKMAVLLLPLYWVLSLGGAHWRATLVAGPPATPSQTIEVYCNACLTVGQRLFARITRPALQSLEQSSNELSAGLNEQRHSPRRIRRGKQPVALPVARFFARTFISAESLGGLRSTYAGFRYGRSPPEA